MPNLTKENGSVLVLVAIGLTAFLALAGLVVDVGVLYFKRASLVNTVDAAALAGAQDLTTLPYNARQRAVEFAQLNNPQLTDIDVEIGGQNRAITVTARQEADLFFLRLLGINTARLSARAKAMVGVVSGFNNIAPLGIVDDNFQYGHKYYLKLGPQTEPGNFQGNFGALALGGTGASNYEDNLINGYRDYIRVGDKLLTETGNMAGPTKRAISQRIAMAPNCSLATASINCPRVVVVPVIDSLDVPGRKEVTVVGFAAFYLEEALNSKDSFVVGTFLQLVVDGEIGDGANRGVRAYRLVE